MKSRILVTGATGFLGSAVTEQLRSENVPVRETGRRGELDPVRDYRPFDLRQTARLPELLEGVAGIVHCAGLAHQFSSAKNRDAQLFWEFNVQATEQLARAAAQQGVERFVFVSSVSAYGPAGDSQPRNEAASTHPVGPYAESKREAELRLLNIASEIGLQVVILRLATLYGEGDPGNVGRLMDAIARGRFLMIGPGTNRKSVLHKDDAASACVKAVLNPLDQPAGIWNVAGESHSMKAIVEQIAISLHRKPPGRSFPVGIASGLLAGMAVMGVGRFRSWAKSRRRTLEKWLADDAYDGSQFIKDFDWQPKVSLEDGLHRQARGIVPFYETTKRAA